MFFFDDLGAEAGPSPSGCLARPLLLLLLLALIQPRNVQKHQNAISPNLYLRAAPGVEFLSRETLHGPRDFGLLSWQRPS